MGIDLVYELSSGLILQYTDRQRTNTFVPVLGFKVYNCSQNILLEYNKKGESIAYPYFRFILGYLKVQYLKQSW